MQKSMGIESMVLVRDASNAMRPAFFFNTVVLALAVSVGAGLL